MKRIMLAIALILAINAQAAERETAQYKGLTVREPAPYGEAGLAWQNNFTALADRIGPCKFDATTAPTAGDDTTAGYATGSLWLDTAANRLYWCASAAAGAATWIEVSPADLSQVYQPLNANLTTWSGVASSADGRAIVSAADYAAMRGLLGLGTMATQGAGSVAITGGAINGTTIGATTPATIKATTLETTGAIGIGGAPEAGFQLKAYQTAHDKCFKMVGYDTQSSYYYYVGVGMYGNAFMTTNGYMEIASGTGKMLYINAGGAVAGSNVILFNGTTANQTLQIHGRDTGESATKYGSLQVATDGSFVVRSPSSEPLKLGAASGTLVTVAPTGELSIPSDTVGLKLDAAGTTTLISNGTVATLSKPLKAAGYQAADGSAGISQTIAIVDKVDVTHTLVFKDGLLTNYSTAP